MELSPFKKKNTSQKQSIFEEYNPTIYTKKTWIQKVSGTTQMQIQMNNCNNKTNTTSKKDGVGKRRPTRHPKRMVLANPIKAFLP